MAIKFPIAFAVTRNAKKISATSAEPKLFPRAKNAKRIFRAIINARSTFVGRSARVPLHCDGCGAPFPWAEAQKQKALNEAAKIESRKEDHIELIKLICQRFPLFARQLQSRHNGRNTIEFNDEYDIQDALHAILKLHFKDIRAEEYTPSYAGGASRIDFLLHDEEIAIEIKKTRQGLRDKEIGEQLIIDKERYKSHPKCKVLICFIYDPEHRIGNPSAIEKDLTQKESVPQVFAIISPNV